VPKAGGGEERREKKNKDRPESSARTGYGEEKAMPSLS
jgi:hypothetical protein